MLKPMLWETACCRQRLELKIVLRFIGISECKIQPLRSFEIVADIRTCTCEFKYGDLLDGETNNCYTFLGSNIG